MAPRNLSAVMLALLLALPAPAAADPVADFYRGKTLTMLVATSPGGDYDLRARLVARHIGRHIPGEPAIIARNNSSPLSDLACARASPSSCILSAPESQLRIATISAVLRVKRASGLALPSFAAEPTSPLVGA